MDTEIEQQSKPRKAMSARSIASEKRLGRHADADPRSRGLYLDVRAGRNGLLKAWVHRYTSPITGKRVEMWLGPADVIPLAEARDLIIENRKLIQKGQDPLQERVCAFKSSITFDAAALACIEARKPEWRNEKHASQWANTLQTYASPIIGKMDVKAITVMHCLEVLRPIWTAKPETASRVRQRLEKVFDWSKAAGYLTGENPARLEGNLAELLPKISKQKRTRNHPSLPYQRIHEFAETLRQRQGVASSALEFLILTAARTNEVLGARWSEIDLQAAIWTIPAERMKAGRTHRVPLSTRAVEIIKEQHATQTAPDSPFVFPTPRITTAGLSNGALLKKMRDMGFADFVPHGFRATFKTWATETTLFQREIIEGCLAHSNRDATEAAYIRGDAIDKRRTVMNAWADFIEGVDQNTSKVTPIKSAA